MNPLKTVEDRFEITVEEVHAVELGIYHWLETEQVIQDIPLRLEKRLANAMGESLIGYGDVDVVIEPDTAGDIVPTREVKHLRIEFVEPGEVRVTGRNDDPISLRVLHVDEVDGIAIVVDHVILSEGAHPLTAHLADEDGRGIIGLHYLDHELVYTTDDETVCKVVSLDIELPDIPELSDTRLLEVLSEGECTIRATAGPFEGQKTIRID